MLRKSNNEMAELAQEGVDILEQQLTIHPPDGVTASDVEGVFQRQRPVLVATLAGMLGAVAARQAARASSSVETITSSEHMLAELERLIDDGEEHRLVVLAGPAFQRFSITPDVDGIYVAPEGSLGKEKKLDETGARALLDFLPSVYPAATGGVLVAVLDSVAGLEEPELSEMPAVRALYDSILPHGGPPEATFELAVRLHRAVMKVRPDGWRGIRAREQVIKRALYEIFRDEEATERLFKVVKNHKAY